MPEMTNDEESFIKEGEKIEKELGFKPLDGFQLFNGQAHYGVVVTDIDEDKHEAEPDINNIKAYTSAPSPLHVMVDVWQSLFHQSIAAGLIKAYTSAPSPLHVMVDVWQSLFHQSIAAGLSAMGRFMQEAREESGRDDTHVLERMISMLQDEDFAVKFVSNLFSVQPEAIVIGNPNVLANFQVSSYNHEEFSKNVEDFLKEVTENKDEEE